MTRTRTKQFLLILSICFIVLIVFAAIFMTEAWSIIRDAVSVPSEAVFNLSLGIVFFFFAGILLLMGLFTLVLIPNKTNASERIGDNRHQG